jgi:hypothetical protein
MVMASIGILFLQFGVGQYLVLQSQQLKIRDNGPPFTPFVQMGCDNWIKSLFWNHHTNSVDLMGIMPNRTKCGDFDLNSFALRTQTINNTINMIPHWKLASMSPRGTEVIHLQYETKAIPRQVQIVYRNQTSSDWIYIYRDDNHYNAEFAATITINKRYLNYGAPWSTNKTESMLSLWINHHLNVGFDLLYIVDNGATAAHVKDICSRDKQRIVYLNGRSHDQYHQVVIENTVIHATSATWMLVIDPDEFLSLHGHSLNKTVETFASTRCPFSRKRKEAEKQCRPVQANERVSNLELYVNYAKYIHEDGTFHYLRDRGPWNKKSFVRTNDTKFLEVHYFFSRKPETLGFRKDKNDIVPISTALTPAYAVLNHISDEDVP